MMKMMNECNCFVVETACWVCVCERERGVAVFKRKDGVYFFYIKRLHPR